MNDFGKVNSDVVLSQAELNNLRRDLRVALLELASNKVIMPDFKVDNIKASSGKKIVDYHYTVNGTSEFISQQIKFNRIRRDIKEKMSEVGDQKTISIT